MGLKSIIYKALGKAAKGLERRGKRKTRKYNTGGGRLFNDWKTSQTSANNELETALSALRNNSRDLYQNSDYVRRFIGLMKTNVVGHAGVMLKNKALQVNGEPDKVANSKIHVSYKKFCKPGITTVCGRYSMVDLLKQVIHSVVIDGEILIRFVRYKKSPFKFALQLIEADHLDEKLFRNLQNGNQIKMGVEVDQYDRAVAYWLLKYHPGDYRSKHDGNKWQRVPAEEILHIFIPERPNQVRGVTWLCSSATRLKMLDGFEEATLVHQRVAASTMGIIHNNDGEEYTGDDPVSDDEYDETQPEDGEIIFTAEAGTFKQVFGDKTIEKWDPQPPGTTFGDFVQGVLRGVSSGWNMSYENIGNDRRGSSYSSMRQAEIGDRDNYRIYQVFLIEHFCQPVYEFWLYEALATGEVRLPLFKIDQFNAATWRPRGWMWVDPEKESKAAQRDISNNIESAEDIAARRGGDIYENIEENAAVKKTSTTAGLTMPAFTQEEDDGNQGTTQASQE